VIEWRNKMKRVIIFQENTPPAELHDPDTSNLEEYTKNLNKVLDSGNVTILTTPQTSLIVKPSKVTSILVQEIDDPIDKEMNMELVKEPKEKDEISKEKIEEEDIDIVTDIDE